MDKQYSFRSFAYSVIVIGCILALVSAVVPFFNTGYELRLSVLLSGLLPYLIYGLAVPFLGGWLLALPGAVLVILHTWLVANERFLDNADYSNGMIYYAPVVLAVILLPLVLRALHEPWGAKSDDPAPQHPESSH